MDINLKINTSNKPGVTLETLKIFDNYGIDIMLLEVLSEVIYVKYTLQDIELKNKIYSEIELQKFTKSFEEINYFPSEIQLQQLLELLSKFNDSVIITDEDYTINYENDAFKKINKKKITNLKSLFSHYPELNPSYDYMTEDIFEVSIGNENMNASITSFLSTIDNKQQYIWVIYGNDDFQKKFIKPHYQTVNKLDDIVYSSKQMKQLIDIAKTISKTDVTVLIRGESGTGKELFARGIHQYSKRKDLPFITVNCSAIPDSLLESELFGYEGGTFTGSLKDGKKGLFEQANKGTIFLDEIGDMPFHLQSKLLRAIETKYIRRLGGEKEIELDLRIIAATHQPLEEMIDNSLFRLDLFYRLNVHSIQIPPLRIRKEDIRDLVEHFLTKFNQLFKKKSFFSDNALLVFENYEWPGNVRELENTIERSVFLSLGNKISQNDLKLNQNTKVKSPNFTEIDGKSYKEMLSQFESGIFNHPDFLSKTTRQIATELGLSHTSVANKIRKYR